MSALSPRGIVVPDRPLPVFEFGYDAMRLRPCLAFIEEAMSDDEAWEALFSDDLRLSSFKSVYGNRKGKRPKRSPQRAFDLFPAEGIVTLPLYAAPLVTLALVGVIDIVMSRRPRFGHEKGAT